MANYELAQLNIAHLLAPLDSGQLSDFVNNLDRINTLAEASDGFVWRLKDETGNATDLNHPFPNDIIVNLSVWQSVELLQDYVFRSAHSDIMKRKKEWFYPAQEANMVLWWVKAGHRPTALEAHTRLMQLRAGEQTADQPAVFTFSRAQPAPDSEGHTG